MGIRYELVGYNTHNQELAVRYEIPLLHQHKVKELIVPPSNSFDGYAEYPLRAKEVMVIAALLGRNDIIPNNFNYSLSPFFVG